VRDARSADIATRREPITGVSEFPDLTEGDVAVLAPLPPSKPAPHLPAIRLAEPFEALRDCARAIAAAPSVFLANLGALADFGPRATFAKNAFEAAGIAAPSNDGFARGDATDLAALALAFRASGARIACLCGSDAVYAAEAPAAAEALKRAGAEGLFLAGRPGENEPALRSAEIEGFVFAGCDMLTFLGAVLDRLEGLP
jgi:methylmalonyl-CoA mutase